MAWLEQQRKKRQLYPQKPHRWQECPWLQPYPDPYPEKPHDR